MTELGLHCREFKYRKPLSVSRRTTALHIAMRRSHYGSKFFPMDGRDLSFMSTSRFLPVATIGVLTVALLCGWYFLSPRLAISQLSDWHTAPEDLVELYDQEKVRLAFEQQMLPQVEGYPPPFTKDVILDAMSDPRAIRAFVIEPYGEWPFAAAAGLPSELITEERGDGMPRIMEVAREWEFARRGFDEVIASPSDREGQLGNVYHFERDGLRWRLVAIQLTTKIR